MAQPAFPHWLSGEGEMVRRIGQHDWGATPLGPIDQWPASLRGALTLMLDHPLPMVLGWGPDLVTIYNDAYRSVLGEKPEALGRPLLTVWDEVRDIIVPPVADVLAGKAIAVERAPFTLTRGAYPEQRWFDYTISPLRDEAGQVAGLLATAIERTAQVLTERRQAAAHARSRVDDERQAFLLRFSDALRAEANPDIIGTRAASLFAEHLELDRCCISVFLPQENGWAVLRQFHRQHLEALPTTIRVHDHADAINLIADQNLAYENIATDPRLSAFERTSFEALGIGAMMVSAMVSAPRQDQRDAIWAFCAGSSTPRRWTSSERSLIDDVAERTWNAIERAHAKIALSASEEKYRTLFDAIDESICVIEVLQTGDEKPDFRYIEANEAHARQTGLLNVDGKLGSEVVPDAEPYWHEAFGTIVRTGVPTRAEHFNHDTDRWYDIFASRVGGPGSRLVCIVAKDTTERREREERQGFLLMLSDRLRTKGPRDIASTSVNLLAERMGLDRAYIAEVDKAGDRAVIGPEYRRPDLAPVEGVLTLSDFPEAWARVEAATLVLEDTATDPSLSDEDRAGFAGIGMGALMVASARKGSGNPVWALLVASEAARRWTPDDVALVEEVAERTWAAIERSRIANALRATQERQAFLLTLSDAVRPLAEPAEIQATALRLLAGHLGLSRAAYLEIDQDHQRARRVAAYDGDLSPLSADMRLSEFSAEQVACHLEGRTFVVTDTETDPRVAATRAAYRAVQMRAFIGVPLVKNGRLLVVLGVEKMTPHEWSDAEVRLVEEAAERTWAASERGRTEAVLQESEQRFREFGENSSDALWIVDAHTGQLEYLSPAFERIWGERRDAVMADISHWARCIHPDDQAAASQAMPRLLVGEAFQADYRIIRADGQVRWIRDAGFPIKVNGIVKRGGGIAQDVTDLRRAEAAVQESEARLRAFGEASQDVLWIRDAETLQWQYLTSAFEAIYGQRRDDVLGGDDYRSWLALIVPEDRAHAMANIRRVLAGERVAFEYRIRRPSDGAIRWLRNTDFPIRDDAGNVTLIGGIGHDFTELREAELRLKTLVEGIPQLVWRAATSGLWTWASPQWTVYTGQAEADSHGWGWLGPIHPDDRDAARAAWSQAVERGEFQVEYRIADREGAYRWFQTRAVPVRDEGDRIVEWLGTSTDIHDLRLLQNRQQVMVQELQHRTRNLITVVSALSKQTLKNAVSLDDFDHRFGDRLSALSRVQGLLSHLSAGKRVTFDELLGSELAAVGAPAGKVTLDGPEGVPLRSTTVQTFSLALHELATNALKYGALAAVDGHLTVRWSVADADRNEPRLRVDWRETGVVITHVGEDARDGGYGRELIERALPYQLNANTSYEMTAEGVHCMIDVPVSMIAMNLDRASG